MNYLYTKLMSWAVGEALANSDRVRVMAVALCGILFTRILAACPQCSMILTPDVVQALTVALGGAAVTLVAALSHRDVGAPGQVVPGAAPVVPPVPVLPSGTATKAAAFLLIGLLGLASTGRAQYALGMGGLLGSSTWDVSDGGAWVPSGSTVGGGELNFAYGATDTTGKFNPEAVILVGLGGENLDGSNYADVLLGGGPVIPGTAGIPLVVAADWRMFTGKRYPAVMLGTSFQFGQLLWTSK